jgi:hypothetical protein
MLSVAAVVVVCDLIQKGLSITRSEAFHARSGREAGVMLALCVLDLLVLPRAGSRLIGAGGGLMIGGGIANLLSLAAFSGRGIPDPFLLQVGAHAIAFNLADVCVASGLSILIPSVLAFVIAHREELEWSLSKRVRRPAGAALAQAGGVAAPVEPPGAAAGTRPAEQANGAGGEDAAPLIPSERCEELPSVLHARALCEAEEALESRIADLGEQQEIALRALVEAESQRRLLARASLLLEGQAASSPSSDSRSTAAGGRSLVP